MRPPVAFLAKKKGLQTQKPSRNLATNEVFFVPNKIEH